MPGGATRRGCATAWFLDGRGRGETEFPHGLRQAGAVRKAGFPIALPPAWARPRSSHGQECRESGFPQFFERTRRGRKGKLPRLARGEALRLPAIKGQPEHNREQEPVELFAHDHQHGHDMA